MDARGDRDLRRARCVITVVNLLYLLAQVAIAAEDCSVGAACLRVGEFLRREARSIGVLFGALLVIVGLATIASLLAMASLASSASSRSSDWRSCRSSCWPGWCARSSSSIWASRHCARTCGCIEAARCRVTATFPVRPCRRSGPHELRTILLGRAAPACRSRPSGKMGTLGSRVIRPGLVRTRLSRRDDVSVGRTRGDRGRSASAATRRQPAVRTTRGLARWSRRLVGVLAARHIPLTTDQILVTRGSQQAVDLLARVLVDPR